MSTTTQQLLPSQSGVRRRMPQLITHPAASLVDIVAVEAQILELGGQEWEAPSRSAKNVNGLLERRVDRCTHLRWLAALRRRAGRGPAM